MTCWIIVIVLAVVAFLFWQQLLKWKHWKDAMKQWVQDYESWIAQNCTCDQPNPPTPPDPPTWPNGEW